MSLSAGLACAAELASTFAAAASSPTRALVVAIDPSAQLVCVDTTPSSQHFAADFVALQSVLASRPQTPCFLLVKTDAATPSGECAWLLIQWVPDTAHVRDKMLYASSRATLLRELGNARFVDSLFATNLAECSWEGYQAHLAHKSADAPRSEKEIELEQLKLTETGAEIGTSTRQEIAAGVGFRFDERAEDAVRGLNAGGRMNAVALTIENEVISLGPSSSSATPDTLRDLLPEGEPFFLFYKHVHEHEGASLYPVLFFYICPPESKVKSRMLFSSSRASTLEYVESGLGVPIVKKIELDSASEIDAAFVQDCLYPAKETLAQSRPLFKKPARPGKR